MQLPTISTTHPYTPLAADLYMCMANIYNILTAYDGVGDGVYGDGVFDSIFCMVVYVNTGNACTCNDQYGFIAQTIHACMKQITQEHTKKVKAHTTTGGDDDEYDDEYGDGNGDDGEHGIDADERTTPQLILNMVCVSNLPRNSRVECEVIALKPGVFPIHLLRYTEGVGEDHKSVHDHIDEEGGAVLAHILPTHHTPAPCDYFALPLEKWDIWDVDIPLPPTHATLNTALPSSPPLPVGPYTSSQFDCSYSIRYITNCIAAMSIVMAASSQPVSEHTRPPTYRSSEYIQGLVHSLCDTIPRVCGLISIPLTYIHTIRCFVPVHTHTHQSEHVYQIQHILTAYLRTHMRIQPAVVCVPVVCLLGHTRTHTPELSVQIVMVDLQQVETELWVARERY
ncbi:hypothetical protein EON63_02755 [archaeon]|nr:MAG: hypothetical protein EON63_02755 [archaeon]